MKKAAALRYDPSKESSPRVIAKGQGQSAENIIKIAQLHNLPIKKDEDLIEFVEDRPGHDIRYSLNSQTIRQLGWSPEYCFREGIIETIGWYLNNEWWWESLANKKILHPTPWKLNW